jgi:hypothetical protein
MSYEPKNEPESSQEPEQSIEPPVYHDLEKSLNNEIQIPKYYEMQESDRGEGNDGHEIKD